jgi:hypothetical protein
MLCPVPVLGCVRRNAEGTTIRSIVLSLKTWHVVDVPSVNFVGWDLREPATLTCLHTSIQVRVGSC